MKRDTCDLCFAQSGYLKSHVGTHIGEKPFKFETCGLCFAQNGNLTTHLRTQNIPHRWQTWKLLSDDSLFSRKTTVK